MKRFDNGHSVCSEPFFLIRSRFISYQFLGLLLTTAGALDPNRDLSDFHIRSWTNKDGLPNNTITALRQTHDGYIWLGTPSGLVRFDGFRFTIFNRKNTQLFANEHVLCLYEDYQKILWLGTNGGGLFSINNSRWQNYTDRNGLSNNHIRAIIMDWQNNLWLGTEYGLNKLNENKFRRYTTDDGLDDNLITSLCLDYQGNLWIGTLNGGLVKFKDNIFTLYTYKQGLVNPFIFSLASDAQSQIWIGTQRGLYYLNQPLDIILPVAGTTYTPVTAVQPGEQNSLWIGTMADGLKCLYKNRLKNYSREQGFPDDYIRCILEDRDGYIWIGTESEGLLQLKPSFITNITRAEGLPENAVCAVLQDHRNNLWTGMRATGLCKIRDGKFDRLLNTKSGLSSDYIRVIFEDSDQRLWIGTEGGGINLLQGDNITRYTIQDGLPANTIAAIAEDKLHNIWIGTDRGLSLFRAGRFETIPFDSLVSTGAIQTLLAGRDNTVYTGTQNGLFQVKQNQGGSYRIYPLRSNTDITALYEDAAGHLWIGTNGDGLLRRNGQNYLIIANEQGLPVTHVYSICEDDRHNLWLSSDRGVLKIMHLQLEDLINRKNTRIFPKWYDQNQGMTSAQCSKGCQPGVFKSARHLFYPTARGIAVFDITAEDTSSSTPEPVLESVRYNKISIPIQQKLRLYHSQGALELRFTVFDYDAPEKSYLQYQLSGADSDFIPLEYGADRMVQYINLDAGNYSFRVKTLRNNGRLSEAFTLVDIEIIQPWYRTIIVLGSGLMMASGLVLIVYYFVHKRKKSVTGHVKYKTITIDPQKVRVIEQNLHHYMEEEKVFLNPDLTLSDLARMVKIHQNHLSRIINERFGLNFNDFVNRYRIEEVCRRFSRTEDRDKSILEIMYETGFYSKSVFNTAFKKFTGMTPSEFRKEPPKSKN